MTDHQRMIKQAALAYLKYGLAVLPISPATKRTPTSFEKDEAGNPLWPHGFKWKHLQDELPAVPDVESWIMSYPTCWIGVACGRGSKNLEILDFDVPGKKGEAPAFAPWIQMLEAHGHQDLIAKLAMQESVSKGIHVWYRCETEVEGSQKLAERPATEAELAVSGQKKRVLIETRGQGGLVVVHPSPGYRWIQHDHELIPTITAEEREVLLSFARFFNVEPDAPVSVSSGPRTDIEVGQRSGDDFDARGSWYALLEPHGWRMAATSGPYTYWVRPGKKASDGHSARTGVGSQGDRFYCWSTAAGVPAEQLLTKFAVFAWLNSGGDYSAAALELGKQGYGPKAAAMAGKSVNSRDRVPDGLSPGIYRSITQQEEEGAFEDREADTSLDFQANDVGNAERLVHLYGKDFRYCSLWGRWLCWDGKRWKQDETGGSPVYRAAIAMVRGIAREAMRPGREGKRGEMLEWAGKCHSRSRIDNMVALARHMPGIPVTPDELDQDTELLNVANGTIDLRTLELKPHDRDQLITRLIDVPFEPEADCPFWLTFLDRVLAGDEDLMRYVWKAAGYTLTGHVSAKCFFFLYGTGDNGKSIFIETIQALLGDYGTTLNVESLMVQPMGSGATNDIASLKGRRFVVSTETEDGKRLSESTIKRLTGDDTISARFLHQEFFSFKPQFKLWLMGNHKPTIRGTDPAIWRRVSLVPFEVSIPKEEQIPSNEMHRRLRAEFPGILAWLIEGCAQWAKEGLAKPEKILAAVSSYREENDILGKFLDERTYSDSSIAIKASEMFESYQKWCKANGEFSMSSHRFGKAMRERGEEPKRSKDGNYYHGRGLME